MKVRRPNRPAAVIVGLAVVALAACGGGSSSNDDAGAPASRPSSPATITIVNPAPGTVASGGKLAVQIDLKNGQVIDESKGHAEGNTPDHGHIHVSLNGRLVQMNYALDSEIEVPPGNHVLEAEFVAADHAPFNPRVMSTATFQMQ